MQRPCICTAPLARGACALFADCKALVSRRKVAVPVPDGASWESFCRTVQQKLKLLGIDSIYLASVIICHLPAVVPMHTFVPQSLSRFPTGGSHTSPILQSGEQVFRTEELQDIDELFVVEASAWSLLSSCRMLGKLRAPCGCNGPQLNPEP